MKPLTQILIASLLLLQPSLGLARDPITIPAATFKQMKKGKKLERVWSAPGFDGTKGVRLGALTDESEEFAGIVLEYLPLALRRFIKNDSPYTLHIAVVEAALKSSSSGSSSARVQMEGRILDQTGTIVSAFTAYATETIGGTANDNARTAVNTIVFALTKDLFPAALPTNEKSPAVIVPAPTPSTASMPVPAPIPPAPAPSVVIVPPAAAQPLPPTASLSPVLPAPAPSIPPVNAPPTPPEPIPVVLKPAPAPMIPASIQASMKRGSALSELWISPAFEKAKGFSLGEVRYQVETRNDGIDKVLPEALAGIATQGAPCVLEIQIVELTIRSQNKGNSNVDLGVEGRLVAMDGTLVAAFRTRESVAGIGDRVDDCRLAARKIVQAIGKDLR